MHVHVGESLYGKVDQVPGLFHVATKFSHAYYLPIVPQGSYLVDERWTPPRERPIGWSNKSILIAWVRVALWLAATGFTAAAACLLVMLAERERVLQEMVGALVGSAVFWDLFYRSYRFTHATPLRALELARVAGIAPEELAPYFLNHPDLPNVNDETPDTDTPTFRE
jgi:hypothetical protein